MSIKIEVKYRRRTMREAKKDIKKESTLKVALEKLVLVSELRSATPIDTGNARRGWQTTRTGIENPVEYIDKLNQGHSPQARPHFIEKTLLTHKGVHPSGIIVRRR